MEKEEAKILVVDDEEHFRTILTSIMGEEGFKVLEAPDGETALRMLRVNSRISC